MNTYKVILLCLLCVACGCSKATRTDKIITVSIEPIRYLTEQITGNDFQINVLVPPGASPETYEPTPAQMAKVANSMIYANIGLIDFEKNLTKSIVANMPDVRVVDLHTGIEPIAGMCTHGHDKHGHNHGTDPHIWSSPKSLRIMAQNLYEIIHATYPDSSNYTANYEKLIRTIDSTDTALQAILLNGRKEFMIYHPALTYLARDYGLTQIALENEGKEPSADYIKRLINQANALKINTIFYQKQFSKSTVEAIAREINAECVAIDPLGHDVINNTLEIGALIVQ